MNFVNFTLIGIALGLSILLVYYLVLRRIWIGVLITGTFLIRALVALWLEIGDLKYNFVVDSMGYEYRSWLLAQKWMSTDTFKSLTYASATKFNLYEKYLASLFYVFGKQPLLATMLNCFYASLTIFFIHRLQIEFFSVEKREESHGIPAILTVVILGLYPSFVIWTSSNIRDSLYFLSCVAFLYGFLCTFSLKNKVTPLKRIGSLLLAAAGFWLVLGLREYVNTLLLGAVGSGLLLYLLIRKVPPILVLPCVLLILTLTIVGLEILMPNFIMDNLDGLRETRESFANIRALDSYAKSSFSLDQSFTSLYDVFLFLPVSLSHYFLAPFPWEIRGTTQLIAFAEVLIVCALIYPTIIGIKRAYPRAPFSTTVVLTFCAVFVVAQSLVISNMGTIFRHRTLPFLFLSIFSGEGLYALSKKYLPALFTPQYWRTFFTRSQSFGRT